MRISLLASSFSCTSPLPVTRTGSHCLSSDLGLIVALIFLAQCCLVGNTVSYCNFFSLSGTFFMAHVGILKMTFYLLNLDVERLHWKLKIKSVIMPSYAMIKNLALKFEFFFF